MDKITESQSVERLGSLYTSTFLKDKENNHIKISVRLDMEYTNVNKTTFYRVFVAYKNKSCRNWKSTAEIPLCDRYIHPLIKGLTKDESLQAVYTAMNNHWERLNPLNGYCEGTLNGVPQSFKVVPLNTTGIFNR